MDDKELRQQLHHAADARLSGLEPDPWLAERVLANAKGGQKEKKKISVGFVLTIAFLLVVATALAVATLRDFAPWIAQIEQEEGDFIHWPIEKKIIVISALVEQNEIENTISVQELCEGLLSPDEANQRADQLATDFVGNDSICFMNIMQAAWGPFDIWSNEDKAWYSNVMEDVGVDQTDKTVYMIPDDTISQEDAIRIVRRSIAEAYNVNENELNDYHLTVDYQVPEFHESGNEQPYWHVLMEASEEKENRLFYNIELFVHPETGELLETASEILDRRAAIPTQTDNELYQDIREYNLIAREADAWTFGEWPLELKAEYSQDITPRVKAIISSGDLTDLMNCGNVDMQVIAQSTYVYGVPEQAALTQQEAFCAATEALVKAYGLPEDIFDKYEQIGVYYDVTNEPCWKFVFNPKSLPVDELKDGYYDPLFNLCYRVELDAYTGSIIHIEEFPFKVEKPTMDDMLKWY